MTTARQQALEFNRWRLLNFLYTPIMYKKGDNTIGELEYLYWLEAEIEKEKQIETQ